MTSQTTSIRMFNVQQETAEIQAELHAALNRVLGSGRLVLGPEVQAFETRFGEFVGARAGAVGVASGTDALAIALRALGIGNDDEVLTVANTAIPTVAAIRLAGATPVFCDIHPTTLMMNTDDARRHITPRTKAILPVHLFGGAVDMRAVADVAAEYGLHIIEDCAQSVGTTIDGRHTGTFGDAACFSFYPTKNLGALGDGGLCIGDTPAITKRMRLTRAFGTNGKPVAELEGFTSRLDELQAAFLNVKLERLHEQLASRRKIAGWYAELLSNRIRRPALGAGVDASFHLFVIITDRRRELVARLDADGIGYGIHYPTPIHLMPAYAFLGYQPGTLPVTESMASWLLSLPCYPGLDYESVERICACVNGVIG